MFFDGDSDRAAPKNKAKKLIVGYSFTIICHVLKMLLMFGAKQV